MRRRLLRAVPGLLALAWALLAAGHAHGNTPPSPQATASSPPPGKYLFVEIWTMVDGSGDLPRLCIDFPGYSFNSATGQLAPFFEPLPPLYPSAWGFAGSGQGRTGAAGCGAASQLARVEQLPFTTKIALGTGGIVGYMEETRAAPVVLASVATNGTLTATIDGEQVLLAPGDSWQKVVGADLTSNQYNGHYTIRSTLTNYGWQDRARIQGPTQFVWLPLAGR